MNGVVAQSEGQAKDIAAGREMQVLPRMRQAGGGAGGRVDIGGMLGAVAGQPLPAAPAGLMPRPGAIPTAAGLRSIRIDIPRAGQPFTFTKVLNVSDEPLSVQMSAMKAKWHQVRRSVFQLVAFLAGLVITWREWHRDPRVA